MANVFKLTHIARKIEVTQHVKRLIGNALGFYAQLLGTLKQEMFGQHLDVFASFAQSGQAQANDIESMKQIFAEDAFFHTLF